MHQGVFLRQESQHFLERRTPPPDPNAFGTNSQPKTPATSCCAQPDVSRLLGIQEKFIDTAFTKYNVSSR